MAEPTCDDLTDARLDVRFAGYCVHCDRIVERAPDGACAAGHPAEGVTGRLVLVDDEPLPELPRFNLAAFLIPFIWGPAHGQWVGAIFLPIWVFLDSIVATANRGGIPTMLAAAIVVALTLAFQAFFAKRANGLAFRRVIGHVSVADFARRERRWAISAVPAALFLAAWTIGFHVLVAPRLPPQ